MPSIRSLPARLLLPYVAVGAVVGVGLYFRGGRVAAAGFAVAALTAVALFLWAYVRLARRLARVAEFSAAIAAGQPPPPLTPEGDDAVSRLERSLLATANSLWTQLESAREEKSKLEAVLRGMVEGVLVIDRLGTILLSNQRAEWLFGTASTHGSMVGQPLINVTRDPDIQELVREVMRGDTRRGRMREITLEGAGRENLQVTATPIDEPGGVPRLFILVFHDTTELRRLEATRRDFVANVSHELRTPLTAIRGYAETLRGGALQDTELADRFLRVIERHSERLGRLIDDLLTLSDLELGRTEIQRGPMPLVPAVDAAIEVVREKAQRGNVEIRRQVPADLPPLNADADRIEQVLVNLIDNAVKYSRPGGAVTVSAAAVEQPAGPGAPAVRDVGGGPWIEIRVADTGVGVPRQDLPRLTERFYRVDKARSRELGGTGLGLAIVKHIVQAHRGALWIESEVNKGTTVYVSLPAADLNRVAPPVPAA
ncbi:cell wall metabolism sensor histidine kinase WalK [Candidatus Binatia bacterium]|nr:cell wall metabolism sensor histidine kinase WalK [Candidatus Binatia bacterium]